MLIATSFTVDPLVFLVASSKGLEVTTKQPKFIDFYIPFEQWWLRADALSLNLKDLPPVDKRTPFGWLRVPGQIMEPTVLIVCYASDSGGLTTIRRSLKDLSHDLGLPILADVNAALRS